MINYNGEIQQTTPALSAKNRGFLYGDGVFDIVKYVEGSLFFWEEHYLRLMATMRIARMEIPANFTMEFLEAEIKKTIQANALSAKPVLVRTTITRREGGGYTLVGHRVLRQQRHLLQSAEARQRLPDRAFGGRAGRGGAHAVDHHLDPAGGVSLMIQLMPKI